MKFSVITVCYNSEKTIEDTIKSVLDQNYSDFEYIVVDGKSSDNTVNIIEKYKDRIDTFISEKDNSMYEAMNKGIAAASGDYLYFLNSDDLFFDNSVLSVISEILKQDRSIDVLYGPIVKINSDTGETSFKTHETVNREFLYYDCICQQAMFYKDNIFKNFGMFDPKYRIVGDYEWILRTYGKINYRYTQNIIARFRLGGLCNNEKFEVEHQRERAEVVNKYYLPKEKKLMDLRSSLHSRFTRLIDSFLTKLGHHL